MQEGAPFQLIGGHVALDFANTLDNRYDPERVNDLIATYPDFLRFCNQSGLIGPEQFQALSAIGKGTQRALEAAHELREALERLFSAIAMNSPVAASDLEVLNTAVRHALPHRALVSQGSEFGWQWTDIEQDPNGPLWLIADSAANLLVSEGVRRVRRCGNETCRWLFLDTSKNGSRRWCDMKLCGNRVKARNYYRRSRSVPGPAGE